MKASKLKAGLLSLSVLMSALPQTVLAAQEQGDPGRYVIDEPSSEITNAQLVSVVQLAQAEHEKQSGESLAIAAMPASMADDDDIVISLDEGRFDLINDGFTVTWSMPIQVEAATETGILYGLREVNEALESGILPSGTTTETGAVKERALHLDMARKYFDKDWIIRRIKQLSHLKMNTLQLHFSENEGFRIECESHPEVMSDEYLTKDEIREILAVARQYGVQIIPSLDAPGHLKQALADHPDYRLVKADGTVIETALDITNPEAVAFIRDLYAEYADLFQECEYFHIGGDEFINFNESEQYPDLAADAKARFGDEAAAIDSYVGYLNDTAAFMESKGFTVRVWNDGLYHAGTGQTQDLSKSVQVDYWTRMFTSYQSAQDWLDAGYTVVNFCDTVGFGKTRMYYVLGQPFYSHADPQAIFETWHAGVFPCLPEAGSMAQPVYDPAAYPEGLNGASMAIWCDKPDLESLETIESNIEPILSAIGAKL